MFRSIPQRSGGECPTLRAGRMTPAEFNAAKFTQLEAILCDSRCAPSVKIVAAHVYTKYLSAEYGFAWVSRAVLTGELGYNDSTVSHAYDRLEQLGYVTIERHKRGKGGPGRGKTNKVHPSFVALNNVAVSQPISGDGDEIKRCEPRDKTLRATLENVAGPQHDSMKEIKTNEARTSRASPPEGGSRRALSKPRKKDSRQGGGEPRDVGAQHTEVDEKLAAAKHRREPLAFKLPPDYRFIGERDRWVLFRNSEGETWRAPLYGDGEAELVCGQAVGGGETSRQVAVQC